MKRNYRISCAVAGILAAHAAAPAFAQRSDAPAAASEPGTGISEVIVTAQRRLLEALGARDAAGAHDWMARHIRDFRKGYEIAGIDLQLRLPAR